jgi:hypothetical protein
VENTTLFEKRFAMIGKIKEYIFYFGFIESFDDVANDIIYI